MDRALFAVALSAVVVMLQIQTIAMSVRFNVEQRQRGTCRLKLQAVKSLAGSKSPELAKSQEVIDM
jgi:hypothetical protein